MLLSPTATLSEGEGFDISLPWSPTLQWLVARTPPKGLSPCLAALGGSFILAVIPANAGAEAPQRGSGSHSLANLRSREWAKLGMLWSSPHGRPRSLVRYWLISSVNWGGALKKKSHMRCSSTHLLCKARACPKCCAPWAQTQPLSSRHSSASHLVGLQPRLAKPSML